MAVDQNLIVEAACGLLRRHGTAALTRAQELVKIAVNGGDLPSVDRALLVLSEVERQSINSAAP